MILALTKFNLVCHVPTFSLNYYVLYDRKSNKMLLLGFYRFLANCSLLAVYINKMPFSLFQIGLKMSITDKDFTGAHFLKENRALAA